MTKIVSSYLFILSIVLLSSQAFSQISSDNASSSGTHQGMDFYIFCADGPDGDLGSLTATSPTGVNSEFTWEKYDTITSSFVNYRNPNENDTLVSTINDLVDGLYRVVIADTVGVISEDQAWVLNNWIEVYNEEIPDSSSDCDGFMIYADYRYAPLNISDPESGEQYSVRNPNNDFTEEWFQGGEIVRSYIDAYISDPIASDSPVPYELTITDEFGCTGEGQVDYISKVPESVFTTDPMSGEAVLEVVFTNNSINYDSTYWFFYRDDFEIGQELESIENGEPVDSIDFILTDPAPIHKFEHAGNYKIKLVTVKMNETGNCYDTLHMERGTFIEVLETLVEVPNYFSPNGDGANDNFVILTQSLRSMNVRIYNRWGGLVHSWKYSNITSSDYTYEHSVWDGRIGNRMASPGVYYYVIQYEGRDVYRENLDEPGERNRIGKPVQERVTGFVHLFRDKN